MWVLMVGHLYYGDNNNVVTNIEDAQHFENRTDACEIQSWLEYHRVDCTKIIEIKVMKEEDTYKEISDLFGEQKRKGVMKYGGTVDEKDNDDPVYWINHAKEEVADLLVYLTKLAQKLEGK